MTKIPPCYTIALKPAISWSQKCGVFFFSSSNEDKLIMSYSVPSAETSGARQARSQGRSSPGSAPRLEEQRGKAAGRMTTKDTDPLLL